MCPVFILNYKTTKIKTAWYWQKKKKKKTVTEINTTEQRTQDKCTHLFGQLLYDKGV